MSDFRLFPYLINTAALMKAHLLIQSLIFSLLLWWNVKSKNCATALTYFLLSCFFIMLVA